MPAEYNRFRRLMTAEANAAIEGALAAGASAVLVNDSHWDMRNLLAEELHPAAELLCGGPKLRSMVEGVDCGFDAALFVGYHARPARRPPSSTTPTRAGSTRRGSTAARSASWRSTRHWPEPTACRSRW